MRIATREVLDDDHHHNDENEIENKPLGDDEQVTVVVHEAPVFDDPTALHQSNSTTASVNGAAKAKNGEEQQEKTRKQTESDNNKSKDLLLEDERTLYEILGASPTATRDELKKRYIKLARETHPDARIGRKTTTTTRHDNDKDNREEREVLFTEVAAAWRILSDKRERKRYDRSLQAKEFTRNVEKYAGEYADKIARTTAPAVNRVLEMLFRTTTTSTSSSSSSSTTKRNGQTQTSSSSAVAARKGETTKQQTRQTTRATTKRPKVADALTQRKDRITTDSTNTATRGRDREATTTKNGQKIDVGSAIASAVNMQGKKVSRVIDRYELLKKSRELEKISMEEIERSMAIKGELANVMNKRLSLSLRIPNSALTSSEALKLLDGLNTVDSVTFLESIQLKHPLIHDINCLEEVEGEFADKQLEKTIAQRQLTEMREALWKADLKAREAMEAEMAARRALEEAQRQVIAARREFMDWNRMYSSAEGQHRKAMQEMEKVSLALERKQERVRTALRRKEEEVLEVRVTGDRDSLDTLGLSDLERLRKEEGYLRAESNRLDNRAKRLRSRAKKLKRRCEELKAEEEGHSELKRATV